MKKEENLYIKNISGYYSEATKTIRTANIVIPQISSNKLGSWCSEYDFKALGWGSLERLDLWESDVDFGEDSGLFSEQVLVGDNASLQDLNWLMGSSVPSTHFHVYMFALSDQDSINIINEQPVKPSWGMSIAVASYGYLHICETAPERVTSLYSLYMLMVSVLDKYLRTMP